MTPNIRLQAWAPDADPTTPGVIADVDNMLPTLRGWAPDYQLAPGATWNATLGGDCTGASLIRFNNGVGYVYAATTTGVYYINGSFVNDVTPSGYAGSSRISPMSFDIFKNQTLCVSTNNELAADPSFGLAFVPVTDAPPAGTMAVQRNFVILGATSGGGWDYPDGWWCSSQEDATSATAWTPDIATQCAQGRLTATPGPIVRLIAFQDGVIAFKKRGVYRGQYVGPTANTWAWPLISQSIGLAGINAVCDADGVLYWLGFDGFYRFAGGAIERIASAPFEWVRDNSSLSSNGNLVQAQWDGVRRVVRWFVVGATGGQLGIAYHPETDRWGRFRAAAGYCVTVPYETVPTVRGYLDRQEFAPARFLDSTNQLNVYRADPAVSSITTGDIGDDDAVTTFMRARFRNITPLTTGAMTHYHRMNLTEYLTEGATATRNDGKYDVSHGSRWHRLKFSATSGMYETLGFSVDVKRTGQR